MSTPMNIVYSAVQTTKVSQSIEKASLSSENNSSKEAASI
jgi:hypothetical protein